MRIAHLLKAWMIRLAGEGMFVRIRQACQSRTGVTVALVAGGAILGTIALYQPPDEPDFTADDIEFGSFDDLQPSAASSSVPRPLADPPGWARVSAHESGAQPHWSAVGTGGVAPGHAHVADGAQPIPTRLPQPDFGIRPVEAPAANSAPSPPAWLTGTIEWQTPQPKVPRGQIGSYR